MLSVVGYGSIDKDEENWGAGEKIQKSKEMTTARKERMQMTNEKRNLKKKTM